MNNRQDFVRNGIRYYMEIERVKNADFRNSNLESLMKSVFSRVIVISSHSTCRHKKSIKGVVVVILDVSF